MIAIRPATPPATPPAILRPSRRETKSTCPYCGVGCGVVIESEGDRITGVRGDPERHER
jgi:assimilatory nitrate reductase catalytic subunit